MAGLIPQPFIDDLLNRTDIVDVVASRVKLKKTGKNYSACCPFHQEKTPSFTVSPDKQFYYCFGCGAGGNAIGFLMDLDKLEFPEAVEELARKAGIEVPHEERRPGQPAPKPRAESPLYALLANAAEFYRQALKGHPARKAAVEYLKGRGLSGEIARDFGLGFAPPGWDNLLKHLGGDALQQKALIEAGLLIDNEESGRRYDRFRDRVMFPIRDSRGRVIGFGGRVLGDDKPKYLNSPETPVFHKGQELYGLYEVRQHSRDLDEVMVVEGYMDVIALAQQGLRNAVATLGTSTSEEHIKRLFRVVPNILFCFDGDKAGRSAAWRALESCLSALQDGRRVRFLFLPEGEDPDSLVRREGEQAFRARMAREGRSLADYFFQHLSAEADPETLEGKAHLASLALPLIERVPGANLKLLMRQRLASITGLSVDQLTELAASTPAPVRQAPAALPAMAEGEVPPAWLDAPPMADYADMAMPVVDEPGVPRRRRAPSQFQVESPPTVSALRALLHHPQLAQKVEDACNLAAEDDQNAQLLVALLESLQKRPDQNPLQLLARWHGTEQGELLRRLAEKEWLIEAESLDQQFFDTITRLTRQQHEQRNARELDALQARDLGSLSVEEKARMRALLAAKLHGV